MIFDGPGERPLPPQAIRALRRHRPALSRLYSSFESATEYARDLFQQPGHHRDNSYYCHTVRYQVAVDLQRNGWSASHFRTLANSGLEILSEGDRLRCWKATPEEEIPAPGESAGRAQFCEQPAEPLFLFEPGEHGIINPGRLVLLWDIDGNLGLSQLLLACPRRLESIWKPVESYWCLRVPHPANWIEPTVDFSEGGGMDFNLDALATDAPTDEPSDQ